MTAFTCKGKVTKLNRCCAKQEWIEEVAKALMQGAEDPNSPAHARMNELIAVMVSFSCVPHWNCLRVSPPPVPSEVIEVLDASLQFSTEGYEGV